MRKNLLVFIWLPSILDFMTKRATLVTPWLLSSSNNSSSVTMDRILEFMISLLEFNVKCSVTVTSIPVLANLVVLSRFSL